MRFWWHCGKFPFSSDILVNKVPLYDSLGNQTVQWSTFFFNLQSKIMIWKKTWKIRIDYCKSLVSRARLSRDQCSAYTVHYRTRTSSSGSLAHLFSSLVDRVYFCLKRLCGNRTIGQALDRPLQIHLHRVAARSIKITRKIIFTQTNKSVGLGLIWWKTQKKSKWARKESDKKVEPKR